MPNPTWRYGDASFYIPAKQLLGSRHDVWWGRSWWVHAVADLHCESLLFLSCLCRFSRFSTGISWDLFCEGLRFILFYLLWIGLYLWGVFKKAGVWYFDKLIVLFLFLYIFDGDELGFILWGFAVLSVLFAVDWIRLDWWGVFEKAGVWYFWQIHGFILHGLADIVSRKKLESIIWVSALLLVLFRSGLKQS